MTEFDVALDGVAKQYGNVTAIDPIHLQIQRGAYLCAFVYSNGRLVGERHF